MGKGDQKTRRGKIQVGSFGVVRPRKKASAKKTTAKVKVEKAAPAKKAAAKKTTKKED